MQELETQAGDAAVAAKCFSEQRRVRQAQVGQMQRGERVIAVTHTLQQLRREDRVVIHSEFADFAVFDIPVTAAGENSTKITVDVVVLIQCKLQQSAQDYTSTVMEINR